MVKDFAADDKVTFADIVLSETRIAGPPHNPGQGGWPTIRYFNKDTGADGASYEKKTGMAVCSELGPGQPYLEQYIREASQLSGDHDEL